jgi:hypothetical protein
LIRQLASARNSIAVATVLPAASPNGDKVVRPHWCDWEDGRLGRSTTGAAAAKAVG